MHWLLGTVLPHLFHFSGKDSCNGDSGGPLMVKEKEFGFFSTVYQIGLVSSGTKYCGVGQPGIYTKVTSFLPWIKSKLQP